MDPQLEVVQQLEVHLEKHTMVHAMVVAELALILLELVAILVQLMENALADQMLNAAFLEENLHGILIKMNTLKKFALTEVKLNQWQLLDAVLPLLLWLLVPLKEVK